MDTNIFKNLISKLVFLAPGRFKAEDILNGEDYTNYVLIDLTEGKIHELKQKDINWYTIITAPGYNCICIKMGNNYYDHYYYQDYKKVWFLLHKNYIGAVSLDNRVTSNNDENILSEPGKIGDIKYYNDYLYVCTGIDKWKRVALSTY